MIYVTHVYLRFASRIIAASQVEFLRTDRAGGLDPENCACSSFTLALLEAKLLFRAFCRNLAALSSRVLKC
jgi:hypothetical protein